MLRALVALVLLANVVFYGWVQGWFAPGFAPPRQGDHEPDRIAAQLHADAVTVLPPVAASAAVTAARAAAVACLQAGPFVEADIAAAESALAAAQLPAGTWSREPVLPPPRWLVYAGRLADPAARRAREAELTRLSLAYEEIDAPADLAPGLVLSRHASRAGAEAALAALAASAPLRGLRVVGLPASPAQTWLRVARADADQQARLLALPGAALAGGFKPCVAKP